MSSLSVNTITDASGGATAVINGVTPSVNNIIGLNRVINGAMMIDQRNAGASVTVPAAAVTFTVDRFFAWSTQASKFSVQQTAAGLAGFSKCLGVSSLSAYTPTSTDSCSIYQGIEGTNMADLGWGTAAASQVTISFWVKSTVTGVQSVTMRNNAQDRSYPATYTINTSNAWEYKTIVIPGETTGTWLTTNGLGAHLIFNLATAAGGASAANTWASANYVASTNAVNALSASGNIFQITGVQLEKGGKATSFGWRQYGTELALCQRYCVAYGNSVQYTHIGIGTAYNATALNITVGIPVPMRTEPALSTVTSGGNWLNAYLGASGTTSNPTPQLGEAGIASYRIYVPSAGSGWTAGQSFWCQVITNAKLILTAEL